MIVALIFGALIVLLVLASLVLLWNGIVWLRCRPEKTGEVSYSYRPSRREWSSYYWRRVRSYLISYTIVLAVLLLIPLLTGHGNLTQQTVSLLTILPGLAAYFVIASLIPAKINIYSLGFNIFAPIPFLPGRKDRTKQVYTDFRAGFRPWRRYNDAMPRGEVLLLRGDPVGAELLIPKGKRDLLLGLARDGLKKARDERRRSRKGKADGE